MKKICTTGSMGSGKSFITKEFSKLGVPTLMMDDVAKLVQVKYVELIQKLQSRFPEGYPNGVLVKEIDEIMLQLEWENFMIHTKSDLHILADPKKVFLQRFKELSN